MKHFQKIFTCLIFCSVYFLFPHWDLLSQDDNLSIKDSLIIGGVYKITLVDGKEYLGELQSYDTLSIKIISDETIINIKQKKIKSIVIPQKDLTSKSSLKDSQSWQSFFSVSLIGGGIIPVGDFAETYNFGGSIGANINYHFHPLWAVYINITNNFLSYKSTNYNKRITSVKTNPANNSKHKGN